MDLKTSPPKGGRHPAFGGGFSVNGFQVPAGPFPVQEQPSRLLDQDEDFVLPGVGEEFKSLSGGGERPHEGFALPP